MPDDTLFYLLRKVDKGFRSNVPYAVIIHVHLHTN